MIVYVLRLKDNKFYVGKSNNAKKCYEDHINGMVCEWTRMYPPIMMDRIIPNARDEYVDMILEEYIRKYGIDNVRGQSMGITDTTIHCTCCNMYGHDRNKCPLIPPSQSLITPDTFSYVLYNIQKQRDTIGCYNCGRLGHNGWDCFADAYKK